MCRLWRLLAEQALEALDLGMAEKAFVLCGKDAFQGVRLVKRLSTMSDRLARGVDHRGKTSLAVHFVCRINVVKIWICSPTVACSEALRLTPGLGLGLGLGEDRTPRGEYHVLVP